MSFQGKILVEQTGRVSVDRGRARCHRIDIETGLDEILSLDCRWQNSVHG